MGTAISITSVKAHFDRVRGRMKTKVNKAEQIIGRYARLRVRAREIGRLWSNCVKTIGSDFSSHILFSSWIIFQWSHRVSYVDVIFIKECKRCRRRRRRHRRECKILSGSIRNARDECGCWWTQTHTHTQTHQWSWSLNSSSTTDDNDRLHQHPHQHVAIVWSYTTKKLLYDAYRQLTINKIYLHFYLCCDWSRSIVQIRRWRRQRREQQQQQQEKMYMFRLS